MASKHNVLDAELSGGLVEQVDYVSNVNRFRYNPFGNTYNPGWRNHPNFSWSTYFKARTRTIKTKSTLGFPATISREKFKFGGVDC